MDWSWFGVRHNVDRLISSIVVFLWSFRCEGIGNILCAYGMVITCARFIFFYDAYTVYSEWGGAHACTSIDSFCIDDYILWANHNSITHISLPGVLLMRLIEAICRYNMYLL